MNHEVKKMGKMIDELISFLLKKNLKHIKTSIDIEDEYTLITIEFDNLSAEVTSLLQETLSQERDASMEEYAWELMGESDASGELNLLGMCTDEFKMEQTDTKTKIYLKRLN